MRLRRLDLARFGRFTDNHIDFGDREEGRPDLHVVYGPNEAGKSTAFAAYLDLLFGIGLKSPYDFLHPSSTMRIGGVLETAGTLREVARIKARQNSLLDAQGQPILEAAILGELGGIDRAGYRAMFSLDDETLETGGNSILESKGDLGQLLFSASAGVAALSASLAALRSETDTFYKFKGRSGGLAELKGRLVAFKAERDALDTAASVYNQLVEARERATVLYEDTLAARGKTRARLDEIARRLSAIPRLLALRTLRERVEPLESLPEPPLGWAKDLPGLQREEIESAVRDRSLKDDIERFTRELDGLSEDAGSVAQNERVERLALWRARQLTADEDLPERRLRRNEADLEIAGLLARIDQTGTSDPRALLLGATTVGCLRELMESRSGIAARARSAADEAKEARRRLREATDKLRDAGAEASTDGGRSARMAVVAATVTAVRAENHPGRRKTAARVREAAREAMADGLRSLLPWRGDEDKLVGMTVPEAATLQGWNTALTELTKSRDRHAGDVERLTSEIHRLNAERTAVGGVAGLITDGEAVAVRADREQAWAAHRAKLDTESADAFDASLRRDDLITVGRFGQMSELARLRQVDQSLALATAELDRAEELRAAAASELDRPHQEIGASARAIAPALEGDLCQLEAWLDRRDTALELREALRAAEREWRAAEDDAKVVSDELKKALSTAAIPAEPDAELQTIIAVAQGALDRETELRGLQTAAADRKRDLAEREQAEKEANLADQAWTDDWAEACAACWIGEGRAAPTSAAVGEILAALANLGPALDKRDGLTDRISKMEADQLAFQSEAKGLATEMGISVADRSANDLALSIADAVREADAEAVRRTTVASELKTAQSARRALADAMEINGRRKAEMTALFAVESLAEVADALAATDKRREWRDQAAGAEREILEALRLMEIAEAETALDAANREALELEQAELNGRAEDEDTRCNELFLARSKAIDQVEAIGGDGRVAAIEERRRTVLLEVEEGAVRYLRLRMGTVAAEQALRAYRDRHRSSMMSLASDAFRTISRGAYTGLATQPEKDSEILIAIAASGGSKAATELSKGTRFQLYLALRVAGYHEFARSRAPVPFVADDIMETFDDFRAEEAFRLFADMAAVGQVIYLTHHQHLCEIVKKVCPAARLHRLDTI